MQFKPNLCPRCGCQPRAFKAQLVCAVPLDRSGDEYEPLFGELRRSPFPPEMPGVITLICGGKHYWRANVVNSKVEV